MDAELLLLTSYFNLVDGRRQDTADTFRVEPGMPSHTSPDGNAALYIVTEGASEGAIGTRARRRATDIVAWEYASHPDDPPLTRLKAALRTAHESIRDEFDGHVAVGMSVIAVEADTVYLCQVAPAQVYVLHEGSLHSISSLDNEEPPYERALGSSAGPRISVSRDQIGMADVVALCPSAFQTKVDSQALRDCFGAGSADGIAEGLLHLAKRAGVRDASVIVAEAMTAEALEKENRHNESPSFMQQVDDAVQSLAFVGKMIWAEFRLVPPTSSSNGHTEIPPETTTPDIVEEKIGSESTRPSPRKFAWRRPLRSADHDEMTSETSLADLLGTSHATADKAVESKPIDEPGGKTGTGPESKTIGDEPQDSRPTTSSDPPQHARIDDATQEVPVVSLNTPASDVDMSVRRPQMNTQQMPIVEQYSAVQQTSELESPVEKSATSRPAPQSELEQVNSRIQQAPELGDVLPPVQAFPDTSTQPERIYATSKEILAANKRPRRLAGASRPVSRDALEGPAVVRPNGNDFELRRPATRSSPPPIIWFSLVVLAVVLAAAAGYVYYHNHQTARAVNPYPALVRKDISYALSAKTSTEQDVFLNKAHANLRRAKQSGSSARQIAILRLKIQNATDSVHHITHIASTQVVTDFGRYLNASPTEIATSPGAVHVLDAGRKSVFSINVAQGHATSQPGLIIQTGDLVNGFTVGVIQHITSAGPAAVAIDDHTVLVRENHGVKTATSLAVPAQQVPKILALQTAPPDVYLLDSVNSQIWRYQGAVSLYNPAPTALFPTSSPRLAQSVSFTMDGSNFFLLQSNGSVLKFDMGAAQQRFSLSLPSFLTLQKPSTIFTDSGLKYLWIADTGAGRIIQFDKAGRYLRTYVASPGTLNLHSLVSFAVGPAGNTFYVLSGKRLVSFPVVP